MSKEVQKNSYNLEEQVQKYVYEGETSLYFNNILGAIKSLNITSVRDVSNIESSMPNSDFLNTLHRTKQWLEGEAAKYAIKNKELPSSGLEGMLKNDPLTENAIRFKWAGLYKPKQTDSEEYNQFIAFSTVWQYEKISRFREFVKQYWTESKQPEKLPKSKPVYGWRYSLRTAVITTFLLSAAGIGGAFYFMEYVLPKKAQQQSQIIINDIIRPAIREEVLYYQNCGVNINENSVNQIAEALEKRYAFLKSMKNFPLPQIIQKEAEKIQQEKQKEQSSEQKQEPSKTKDEEDF